MDHTPRIFVTRSDVPKSALEIFKDCMVEVWEKEGNIPRETFLEKIANKDALLIHSGDKIDAEALDAAGSNLKVISTMSAGLDHINVGEVKKRGIKLGFTSNVLEDAVGELAIGLLIAGIRRFNEGRTHILEGTWPGWMPWSWMNGTKIQGSTVGIIGLGRIGMSVVKKLVGFHPKEILYVAKSDKPHSLPIRATRSTINDVCLKSDIIFVTLPLNEETKEIINEDKFNLMKPNAFLVNVSRGDIIDQDALVKALKENKIAGAALDVMTPEPLPPNHELLSLKNITLLPHIGSAEVSTRIEMAKVASRNIMAGLFNKTMVDEVR